MPLKWTEDNSNSFWDSRQWNIVERNDNLPNKLATFETSQSLRKERESRSFAHFKREFQHCIQSDEAEAFVGLSESEDLSFWMAHASWTKCDKCSSLQGNKLYPKFRNRPTIKNVKDCGCSSGRYIIPKYDEIPNVLKNLSIVEIAALRPFDVHLGDYFVDRHGYRKKGGMFRLTWSKQSVSEKIAMLDPESRRRCAIAYQFLMSSEDSGYSNFVLMRESALRSNRKFNVYDLEMSRYVENCLWPHLYPFRRWCETGVDGSADRLSSKIAFMKKMTSCIADYALSFELLHFHYDLWLFKTVSGAVSVGRNRFCSPAKSLETKFFSSEYWKWQHRFLLDAVRQFGPPSVFLTISPYEWSFPIPPWLSQLQQQTGRGPTELASLETMHIVQVLEQVARGYLGGTNSKMWSNHIFNYNRLPGYSNVNTLFYRFEFQQRGTVHMHMLVFLKDMRQIRLKTIRGDIPWSTPELAHEVHSRQHSDKGVLPKHDGPSELLNVNGQPCLRLHHPKEAFVLNLRAYISTLLPALKCRMDVQTSDGNAMLLRYVTSYVAKCHDNQMTDALYSTKVTPFQAAYRHLRMITPLEPEMFMALAAKRIAYTCSRTKKVTCPNPESIFTMAVHQKYLSRKPQDERLSFIEWLRQYDDSGKRYRSGETLVGVKSRSVMSDVFFYQDLVMNLPHREVTQLLHPDHERLPHAIRHFVAAWCLRPELWQHLDRVEEHFNLEGHKSYYVKNLVNHVKSLRDFFFLWQRRVVGMDIIQPSDVSHSDEEFDPVQRLVLNHVEQALSKRHSSLNDEFQSTIASNCDDLNSGEEQDEEEQEEAHCFPQEQATTDQSMVSPSELDWTKFILLLGKPGTGKTHTVCTSVRRTLEDRFLVAVAGPTGFLASLYRAEFDEEALIDTVHAMFHYPVDTHVAPSVNWSLCEYDLLLIDEVSMIPKKIFQHILRTLQDLPTRPVVLLSGDAQQQQPITESNRRTVETQSILHDKQFYKMVYTYKLVTQYRCEDEKYYEVLNHLRYYKPTQALLSELHRGRVLVTGRPITDDDLFVALCQLPGYTFLTVSRKAANLVNRVAVERLFTTVSLGQVQYDCDLSPMSIYKGMDVIITQNRDKDHGVVNGARGTVLHVQNATVFLKLPRKGVVQTYPVSIWRDDQLFTSYPFVPAYGLTITKAQGQTLRGAIIWLDSPAVPDGGAYVALSRIRKFIDLRFLVETVPTQYKPVTMIPS